MRALSEHLILGSRTTIYAIKPRRPTLRRIILNQKELLATVRGHAYNLFSI